MPARSSKSQQNAQNPTANTPEQPALGGEALLSLDQLRQLLGLMSQAGGVPFTFSTAQQLSLDTAARLTPGTPDANTSKNVGPVSVVFPACGEVLLSLIKTSDKDDLTTFFNEYFKFGQRHQIMSGSLAGVVDDKLLNCPGDIIIQARATDVATENLMGCCYCSPCIIIDGNRNALPGNAKTTSDVQPRQRR